MLAHRIWKKREIKNRKISAEKCDTLLEYYFEDKVWHGVIQLYPYNPNSEPNHEPHPTPIEQILVGNIYI